MTLRTKVRIVGDPERFRKDTYNTFLAFEVECKRRLCKVKGPCELSEQAKPCVFVCMTKKHLDQREVWIKTLLSLRKQVAEYGFELKRGKLLPELASIEGKKMKCQNCIHVRVCMFLRYPPTLPFNVEDCKHFTEAEP